MRRYIDVDKLKTDIKEVADITDGKLTEFEVLGILSGQPTADVVEVVRCDQCRHFEAINNDDHGWCKLISDLPIEVSVRYHDDYCSYGERAEA